MELKHEQSKQKNRFYLLENNQEIGEIKYAYIKDDIIDINHTEVDRAYNGQGLGRKLIEAVADYSRKNNLKISTSCSYAASVFEKSNTYDDIKV